jgi:hypothetical protein|tara:strand:- start:265 stop:378 length:114 start_codon:yes stop_codon:yes gene_type:complete
MSHPIIVKIKGDWYLIVRNPRSSMGIAIKLKKESYPQ